MDTASFPSVPVPRQPLKVLLLTGENNHDWQATTPVIQAILERGGAFRATVETRPRELRPDTFAPYDLILSNWNTFPDNPAGIWSDETRAAFLNHIADGNGFVVVHAGGSMFYDWPEYQRLIGATWGKTSCHGAIFPFMATIVDRTHPVTRDLPEQFAVTDEVWARMAVKGERQILVTAPSDRSKRDEPVCFTTCYDQGRCFNLVLGAEADGMRNPHFQTLLRRGCEWAATGQVTERTQNHHPNT